MIRKINIEYERKAYYNDGLEPECTEVFGDDYFEWDTDVDGEPTLESILLFIEDAEPLSYSEDDVIDFDMYWKNLMKMMK